MLSQLWVTIAIWKFGKRSVAWKPSMPDGIAGPNMSSQTTPLTGADEGCPSRE